MAQDALKSIAQRRSTWNSIKEKLNVPKNIAEYVSSEYGEQMKTIREVDKEMREIGKELNPVLKAARKSFKERRLLDVAHWVGIYNDKLRELTGLVVRLEELKGEHLDQFYTEMEDNSNPYRHYFNDPKAAELNQNLDMLKTAGILDVFKSDRERAAKLLEKMYASQLKKRLGDVSSLLNKAQATTDNILQQMGELDSARSSGNVSEYIKHLNKISTLHKGFENKFRQVYDEHFVPLIAKVKEREQAESAARAKEEEDNRIKREEAKKQWEAQQEKTPLPEQEPPQATVPDLEIPKAPIVVPEPKPAPTEFTAALPKIDEEKMETKPELTVLPGGGEVSAIPTAKKTTKKQPKKKTSKDEFFDELMKTANDPILMARMMVKYSEELEEDGDVDSSMKLLVVAEEAFDNILRDYGFGDEHDEFSELLNEEYHSMTYGQLLDEAKKYKNDGLEVPNEIKKILEEKQLGI